MQIPDLDRVDHRLPPHGLEQLERDGFAGPFAVEDMATVRALREAAERSGRSDLVRRLAKKLGIGSAGDIHQRDSHTRSPEIHRLASCPEIVERVAGVLGPDLLLWIGLVISRSPGNKGQHWHRDRISVLLDAVHVTLALSPMTVRNGATKIVPGSHAYPHSLQQSRRDGLCDLGDDDDVTRFADTIAPRNAPHEAVTVELEPGQFIVARAGFWHAVPPNTSDGVRSALIARYMRPDVASKHWSDDDAGEVVVDNSSLPCILVRGEDRHGLNTLCPPPT